MPIIRFVKDIPEIAVEPGANLMKSLRENGRPVASSCGGQGICTKCLLSVIKGNEFLSKPNQNEIDLKDIQQFPKGMRMSCQVRVEGDVTVDAPYW